MAMHSLFGFTGAFVGPVVFGFVLDAAGGEASGAAWVSAYAALAAIIALGALALFAFGRAGARAPAAKTGRSEEHTSELQSLMRISYAVFCLKKKKHNRPHLITPRILP